MNTFFKRFLLALFVFTFSLWWLSASPVLALTISEAHHLLERTGFGATPSEIAALKNLNKEESVNKIINSLSTKPIQEPPPFIFADIPDYRSKNKIDQKITFARANEIDQLKVWWLDEMISTPSPFTEKIVLFWHNHFVSEYSSTQITVPFYHQLQLFRELGTVSFRELLHGIVKDPTMLTYLNNIENTAKNPNENLAREMLELFTMGIGNYSEKDINELARILAGHSVDRDNNWQYKVKDDWQDKGTKTFLKQTGQFDLDDAVEIILAQEQVSNFLTQKFYREFVSQEPNSSEVMRLAKVWRDNDYLIKPFFKELLMSDSFWAEENRGGLVKSPIELIVGFIRTFGVWMPDAGSLVHYGQILGQELLDPPSVEGWIGGNNWIDNSTLVSRRQIINRLWTAREIGLNYLRESNPNDLLVRISSEYAKQPAQYKVEVNGTIVAEGQTNYGLFMPDEGLSTDPGYLKPNWELIRVSRDRLPQEINTVSISFTNDPSASCDPASNPEDTSCQGQNDTNMFVNWVQIDKQRLTAYQGSQSFTSKNCTNDVPKGMLYCSGGLTFKIAMENNSKLDSSLVDIATPINSMIEYGTSRISLTMKPAGRSREQIVKQQFINELEMIYQQSDLNTEAITSAFLAIKPIQIDLTNKSLELMDLLQALTNDPVFNLK